MFLGWSGALLLPCAYLAAGAWLAGTTFVSSAFTHGLAASYREGCSVLTAAASSPAPALGHSLLLLWGREAAGSLAAWALAGGLWTFVAPHGGLALSRFALRQLEASRLVLVRPHNALAFAGPLSVFLSAFVAYPGGQASWLFGAGFGAAALFRFLLFIQGFHGWTLSPLHMAGAAGVLGGALLSATHGATVLATLYRDGAACASFRAFSPAQPEETYSMVSANRFWSQAFGAAFASKRWLHFLMLPAPVRGLAASAPGLVGLAPNLRAYDLASQEERASADPEFETLYTKNLLLGEGVRLWAAAADQPHERLAPPAAVLPRGNSL